MGWKRKHRGTFSRNARLTFQVVFILASECENTTQAQPPYIGGQERPWNSHEGEGLRKAHNPKMNRCLECFYSLPVGDTEAPLDQFTLVFCFNQIQP